MKPKTKSTWTQTDDLVMSLSHESVHDPCTRSFCTTLVRRSFLEFSFAKELAEQGVSTHFLYVLPALTVVQDWVAQCIQTLQTLQTSMPPRNTEGSPAAQALTRPTWGQRRPGYPILARPASQKAAYDSARRALSQVPSPSVTTQQTRTWSNSMRTISCKRRWRSLLKTAFRQ